MPWLFICVSRVGILGGIQELPRRLDSQDSAEAAWASLPSPRDVLRILTVVPHADPLSWMDQSHNNTLYSQVLFFKKFYLKIITDL